MDQRSRIEEIGMSQQNGPRLGRMIPAMITPFDADREVDFENQKLYM